MEDSEQPDEENELSRYTFLMEDKEIKIESMESSEAESLLQDEGFRNIYRQVLNDDINEPNRSTDPIYLIKAFKEWFEKEDDFVTYSERIEKSIEGQLPTPDDTDETIDQKNDNIVLYAYNRSEDISESHIMGLRVYPSEEDNITAYTLVPDKPESSINWTDTSYSIEERIMINISELDD